MNLSKASGGKYLAAGNFTTYNGAANVHRVVKINNDGTRDTGFNNGASQNPGSVVAFRVVEDSTGEVYLGYGQNSPYLRRYNSDGTFDAGFSFSGGNYSTIEAITLVGTDKLLVGGQSSSVGFTRVVTSNGGVDTGGGWTSPNFSSVFAASGAAKDMVVLNDGRLMIGGNFNRVKDRTLVQNLAVLSANGVLDTNLSEGLSVNGWVYDLHVCPDGKVLVAGGFTSILGVARNGIARLNANLTLDTTFDPGLGAQYANGTGAEVRSVDLRSDGKIVLGGGFATFDGAARSGIVVVNGDPAVLPLSFISPPQAMVVTAGQSASFNVAVNGGATLNFQWYKGNDLIPGATLPYLTITNAAFSNAANYKVTVTSGVDSITSTPVSLSVTEPTALTFAEWRSGYAIPPLEVDPEADPDGDGLPNVVEYVLGTNPTQINQGPQAVKTNVSGTDYPAVKIKRLKAATGFDILVEASLNVNFDVLIDTTLVGITDLGNGLEELNVRINNPLISVDEVFFRIMVAPSEE
jgi:uncharacterized delta-60 repeat protein